MTEEQTVTEQEIFNIVWQHFVVENAPRGLRLEGGSPQCVYRNTQGACCAVGVLMTEEEAVIADGRGVSVGELGTFLPVRLHEHMTLLRQLQHIHDTKWAPERIDESGSRSDALTDLAYAYDLEVP